MFRINRITKSLGKYKSQKHQQVGLCTTEQKFSADKFDSLQYIIKKNTDALLNSETKIHSLFSSVQFHLESYATPYRLDNGGGILLYVREDISSTLLISDLSIEQFFVEIRWQLL